MSELHSLMILLSIMSSMSGYYIVTHGIMGNGFASARQRARYIVGGVIVTFCPLAITILLTY